MGDGVADGLLASLGCFAEPMFELREEHLDGVQVGRVLGQEEQLCADGADGASHGFALVGAEIVHDDDVAWLEGRRENPLDVEGEAFAIDRAIDEPGRVDVVVTQGGQECHGLPAAMRHLGPEAPAAWRPAPERRHIGLGPGLVDEHQAGRVNAVLVGYPLRAPTGDVGTILLAGDQRLFL